VRCSVRSGWKWLELFADRQPAGDHVALSREIRHPAQLAFVIKEATDPISGAGRSFAGARYAGPQTGSTRVRWGSDKVGGLLRRISGVSVTGIVNKRKGGRSQLDC
jgi:hypothetical protein